MLTGYQVYFRNEGDTRVHRREYFSLGKLLTQMKGVARVFGIKVCQDGRYGKMSFMNQIPKTDGLTVKLR